MKPKMVFQALWIILIWPILALTFACVIGLVAYFGGVPGIFLSLAIVLAIVFRQKWFKTWWQESEIEWLNELFKGG